SFSSSSPHNRDLHYVPTRRSSDLGARRRAAQGPRSRPRTGPRRPPCRGASSPRAPRGEQPDPLIDPLEHGLRERRGPLGTVREEDRKSTRLNSSHVKISYAVFCLK